MRIIIMNNIENLYQSFLYYEVKKLETKKTTLKKVTQLAVWHLKDELTVQDMLRDFNQVQSVFLSSYDSECSIICAKLMVKCSALIEKMNNE
jgi:hypothetical protein